MVINIIDLVVAGLVLWYLVKNVGGLVRTSKSILAVIVCLMVFAVVSHLLLSAGFAKPIHKSLSESYAVNFSTNLIKWFYPAIEKNMPKVDLFIKEKILTAPGPSITAETPLPLKNSLLDEAKNITHTQ